jgi:hypothetical protein
MDDDFLSERFFKADLSLKFLNLILDTLLSSETMSVIIIGLS